MVKHVINPIIFKYDFHSFIKTWTSSKTIVSAEFLLNHIKQQGFQYDYKKFIGFYGVTKQDSIDYLRNSKPNLPELNYITNKLHRHITEERFADVYINLLDNPLSLHLWEYYPGTIFQQDELNGFLLKVSEPEKKINRKIIHQKINQKL
jgi:hypothetical protein